MAASVGPPWPATGRARARRRSTALRALGLLVLVSLLATLMPVTAAAHEDETEEGFLLVQQALAHLAHDSGDEGVHLAIEKVADALAAEDQEGLDLELVRAGQRALAQGRTRAARAVLQESIGDAVADLPPATGYATGTTEVWPSLSATGGRGGSDLVLLLVSVAVAAVGMSLSYRFRPADPVRTLRRTLRPSGAPTAGQPEPEGEEHRGTS